MAVADIQTSFAAGEIAPNLYARVDLQKFKVGAALARNWFVDFRGGVSNCPGTQYIATAATTGTERLIPFIVATTDAYVLEFSAALITIYAAGVVVTTVVTPYAASDLLPSGTNPGLKYTQSADVMTLTHPSYPPATLTLNADATWTYAVISVGTAQAAPTSLTPHPPSTTDPDYCYSYVVTAVSLDGKSESMPCAPKLAHYTILDETKGFVIPLSWTASSTPTSLYRVYKCGPYDDRDSTGAGTVWGYIGSSQTTTFTDLNIAPDFSQTPPMYGDPFSGGQIQQITVTGGGSGYPSGGSWTGYIALSFSGDGTGAAGFATTDYTGVVTGAFITNAGKNYTTCTATAGGGGATFHITLSDIAPLYPSVPGYDQQRAVFGSPNAKPATISMSQSGAYTNFNTSPISQPTDAFAFDISSNQVNSIKAFQGVALGLMVFTTNNAFLITGGAQGAAVTPSTVTITPQPANGANDLPPIQINFSVLYMQNRGNIVRDLSFAWQRQSYTGNDISYLANHLFINYTLVDWTWQEAPFKLVWATRNDGQLLCLTYVPEQEVYGWTHRDTQGLFTSVCSIPEGDTNAVYCLVKRFVEGAWVQYVERMADRRVTSVYNAWFVDCGTATVPTYPPYDLTLSSAGPGPTNILTMASLTVGQVIQAGPAQITVDTQTSPTTYTGTITNVVPCAIPNDPTGALFSVFSGEWALYTPVTTLALPQLAGKEVVALADGLVLPPASVDNGGNYTFPYPVANAVVGLAYESQLQTLYLSTDGLEPGTIQGKLKLIPDVTVRQYLSLGMEVGPDFANLTTLPAETDATPQTSYPEQLVSADVRVPIFASWTTEGQVVVSQSAPLPATVLGLIFEVVPGDTQR